MNSKTWAFIFRMWVVPLIYNKMGIAWIWNISLLYITENLVTSQPQFSLSQWYYHENQRSCQHFSWFLSQKSGFPFRLHYTDLRSMYNLDWISQQYSAKIEGHFYSIKLVGSYYIRFIVLWLRRQLEEFKRFTHTNLASSPLKSICKICNHPSFPV